MPSLGCFIASLGTAPPGPFPTLMLLALLAVIAGSSLAILGVKLLSDAWLDGVLTERPSLSINLTIAYVNIAVLTTLSVFCYAFYSRSRYLMYKEAIEAGAAHDASQPWRGPRPKSEKEQLGKRRKNRGSAVCSACAKLMAHLLTIATLALCITMLLVFSAALLVIVSGDYGCGEMSATLEAYNAVPTYLAAVTAASEGPPVELAAALCNGVHSIGDEGSTDRCFKLDIALSVINMVLRQWPMRITRFEAVGDRLSGACASFSSAIAASKSDVCTPLLDGNSSAIAIALAAHNSTYTVDQYVSAAVDFTPGRLRFLALRTVGLLTGADETLREVYAVGSDTCNVFLTLRKPAEWLIIAAAVLLLAAIISRACFVRYSRFLGYVAARNGPHWAPLDAALAALLLSAGMMLGASALGWARQAYQKEVATSVPGATPSIQPVVTAAIIACVFCMLVALLVVLYGVATRHLLQRKTDGCFESTKRAIFCLPAPAAGGPTGASSSCFPAFRRMILQMLVAAVWILTLALVLVALLAVGVTLGGSEVGRFGYHGSVEMHRTLLEPPSSLMNATSGSATARMLYSALVPPPTATLDEPLMTSSGLNRTELCWIYGWLADDEASVRRSCVLGSLAARLAITLINAPPLSAGINASDYAIDCGQLPAALAAGRTQCAEPPGGVPNVVAAASDEARLVHSFIGTYRAIIIFNRHVGDAAQYIYISLDALTGPFVRLLIASLILIAGTALLSSAYSRYTMLEFVFFTKAAIATGQRGAANLGNKDATSRRQSRRESRLGRADANKQAEPQA